MAELNIGNTLKDVRTTRGVILEEMEQVTHINIKYLRALEENDFGVIPGFSYARAYLRQYAELLNINPEPLISAFNTQYGQNNKVELPAELTPSRRKQGNFQRKPVSSWRRVLWIVGIAVVAIILVLVLANQFLPQILKRPNPSSSPTVSTTSPSVPASQTPSVATSPTQVPEVEARVTAREVGTITVMVDDQTIFQGQLDAGTSYTFRKNSFSISFDNPQNYDLQIDGNTVPQPLPSIYRYPATTP